AHGGHASLDQVLVEFRGLGSSASNPTHPLHSGPVADPMHGHAADRALRNVTAKLAGQSSGRAVRLRFIECFVGQLREDQLVVLTFQITRTLILSTMPSAPRQLDDEEFPADLTGHFWATSEYRPELDR